MSFNGQTIQKVNDQILEDLKKELRQQGHYLTGDLERSLVALEQYQFDKVELEGYAFDYITDLEQGIPASQIVINEATLAAMTKYVTLRMGYQGRKAQKVALLILQKQKKEGMPTIASTEYSQTGRRTQAIQITFDQFDDNYTAIIDNETETAMDNEFPKLKNNTII